MKIAQLDGKHPSYDGDELRVNRALVAGGKHVRALIDTLLIPGANEPAPRYEARKKRAYYVNHCAPIVGQMVAWLGSTLPATSSEPEPDKLDPFWTHFQGNCDLSGHSLHQFQMGRIREAFITGRGWSLCELPKPPTGEDKLPVKFESLADEDKAGVRRAYLVPLPTEAVIDWEYDDEDQLLWAIVKDESTPRASPTDSRGLKVVTWTVYDKDGWQQYEWRQKKVGESYKPNADAPLVDQGTHSFGAVPLEEIGLPEDFYILGKIQDHLIEAYNSRCAKSWGMYTNLMPTAVHNRVQSPEPEAGGSDTQIARTRIGAGYGVEIGEVGKEDLFYLETSGAAFEVAAKHISELKDELYRVVHQMALSVDNSAGASKRSGESKSEDKESSEIVLQALSEIEAPSRERKLNMIARARKENVAWDVTPVEKFTLKSSEDVIQECILAGSAGVRSPTFEKEREKKMVRALLPDLKEEDAEKIDQEIEDAVDSDPDGAMGLVTPGADAPAGDDADEPEGTSTEGSSGSDSKPRISAGAQAKANGYRGSRQRRSAADGDRTRG
jgi:hypothetical protein